MFFVCSASYMLIMRDHIDSHIKMSSACSKAVDTIKSWFLSTQVLMITKKNYQ